jgi:hypothetical protein
MVAKFEKDKYILEVDKTDKGISFNIYESGEEQVGQWIELPDKDIHELIRYLQKASNFPNSFFSSN